MNWSGWTDFWAMGGYALYVWGSFGVGFALLAAESWSLRRRWQAAQELVSSAPGATP
jgi:heme exporter protein D